MLETVGAKSLEALMAETLPSSIRQKTLLDIDPALSEPEAGRLLEALTAADLAPALAGALLAALRAKGVVAEELRGFAGAMRSLARKPAPPAPTTTTSNV